MFLFHGKRYLRHYSNQNFLNRECCFNWSPFDSIVADLWWVSLKKWTWAFNGKATYPCYICTVGKRGEWYLAYINKIFVWMTYVKISQNLLPRFLMFACRLIWFRNTTGFNWFLSWAMAPFMDMLRLMLPVWLTQTMSPCMLLIWQSSGVALQFYRHRRLCRLRMTNRESSSSSASR